ncbi:SUMO-conjugating enzyme ubc9 [Cucumispora dikerogammari]|nr:SUMO-conjugating enzyme ubc9 [Cucumispora dikerogammari]
MQRLNTELLQINKNRPYLFYIKRCEGEPTNPTRAHLIKKASVVIECGFPGPPTELYLNSYYRVYILVNETYPYKPPHVVFDAPVFHPNVYTDGYVCLDILQPHKWKPSMGILDICKGLQHLLMTPNIASPANQSATGVLRKSKDKYEDEVKKNIKLYHDKKPWE